MKIKFGELALLFAFGILLSAAWSNIAVYAQNKTATSITASTSSANPVEHVVKVKITSPTRGQQVPVGKDLTISGTSIDNATSNDCKVSVAVNKVRPYQNATATGTGGAADYSKWNFALTSKYTTIKPGENRITSKYDCANDPNAKLFSSVNVTGVPSSTNSTTTGVAATTTKTADAATTVTKPYATTPQAHTTKASIAAKEQPQQHPVTANSNNPASNNAEAQRVAPVSSVNNKPLSSTSTSSIAPQVKTINRQLPQQPPQMITVSNNTDGQNSKLASSSPVIASDKMMYLGYPGSATNNKYLTDKNAMGPKSTTRVSNTDTTTDNSSTNKGSVDIKYRPHDVTKYLTDKNAMGPKSTTRVSNTDTTTDNSSTNVSTSQVNIKRNPGNANNNFIFPFSYP
jgi:hypothetical protein